MATETETIPPLIAPTSTTTSDPLSTLSADNSAKPAKPAERPVDPLEAKVSNACCSLVFFDRPLNEIFLFLVGAFFAALQGLVPPFNMLLFGNIISSIGGADGKVSFQRQIHFLIGTAGVGFLGGLVGVSCLEIIAERQIRRLKLKYLEQLMKQEIGWFDVNDAGNLSSRVEDTSAEIRTGMGYKFAQVFQFTAQFLGGYAIGIARGWRLALVMTCAMPVIAGTLAVMLLGLSKVQRRSMMAFEEAGSLAEEVLSAIRTVAAFGGEQTAVGEFNRRVDKSVKAESYGVLFKAFGGGSLMFCIYATYALGWWYGGVLVAKSIEDNCTGSSCFDAGRVVTVFFALIFASFGLAQIFTNISALITASNSYSRLLSVINRESAIDSSDRGGRAEGELKGEITFRGVSFAYPSRPDKPVFAGLDLHIPAGKTVALVGGSGCGKSTIVQLLERFYDPSEGEITVDGCPLKEYNLKWLRDRIGLVRQEPRLFSFSIEKNISQGKQSGVVSHEAVVQAAKLANADDFISNFPEGYETNAGEGGSMLSGGQKQRIAIARVVVKEPHILILDEATSALDNESERMVQNTLDKLVKMEKRTTVIIAHRLSSIKNADQIIVLNDSLGVGATVAEIGTHNELVSKENGVYRRLVVAQQQAEEDEERSGRAAPKGDMQLEDFGSGNDQESPVPLASPPLSSATSQHRFSILSAISAAALRTLRKRSAREHSKVPREEKGEGAVPDNSKVKLLRLWGYMRPQWYFLTLGSFCAMITGLVFPLAAVLMARFIGIFFSGDPTLIRHESSFWSLMYVALASGMLLVAATQSLSFGYTGECLVARLRKAVFNCMVYQDIAFFDEPQHSTGYLSSVISTECKIVRGVAGDNLSIVLQNMSTFVGAIVISFSTNAELAAVALVGFLFMVPAGALQSYSLRKSMQVKQKSDGSVETSGGVLNETICEIRTVTSDNLQNTMLGRFKAVLDVEYREGKKTGFITGVFSGFATFLMFAAYALSLWYGGLMVNSGRIAIDKMMQTIMPMLFGGNAVGRNLAWGTDRTKARRSCGRIFAIVDRKPDINVRPHLGPAPPVPVEALPLVQRAVDIDGHIKVTGVNFRYPQRPDFEVFRNISLEFLPNRTYAIVGASGCGKSTIIQLLERFYDVSAGRSATKAGGITLDGIDIRNYQLDSLRSVYGLVSQEPVLFNMSIADNIRYGKPDASADEVTAAAKLANAHDFVMTMPDGYDTNVGKGGGRLSGGQKQRIAIARAVIRNPKILLLDEATSALDAESEQVVQEALDAVMVATKRTTIIIAHRLSTVRNADAIIVLSNETNRGAKVAEVGTHDDLIKIPNGIYGNLVKSMEQQQG